MCSMIPILYFRPPMELSGILKIPNILWENWFRKEDFFDDAHLYVCCCCVYIFSRRNFGKKAGIYE